MTHTPPRAAWGVDGCKAGWFYFKLLGSAAPEYGLVTTLAEVVERANAQDLILVDIPIGLPAVTDRHSAFREGDEEARRLLGYPRQLSIFHVPTRRVADALRGVRTLTPDQADRARSLLQEKYPVPDGGKINNQSLAILEKIREADNLLLNMGRSGGGATIRETHPEICFWALNGGEEPMESSKKKPQGKDQRRQVLEDGWPDSVAAIDRAKQQFRRRQVAVDDMLDAMACAVTAARILHDKNALRTLPAKPPRDSMGLPMEMVYAAPDS